MIFVVNKLLKNHNLLEYNKSVYLYMKFNALIIKWRKIEYYDKYIIEL